MKRTLIGTALAVLASAALVAAQGQAPNPSDPPSAPPRPPAAQSPAPSAQTPESQTWTGCLEAGTTPGTYVLSSASASGAAAAKSAPREPAGAAAAGDKGDKFVLSGAPASFNISSHVNHKVEITGTVAEAAAGGAQSKAGRRPRLICRRAPSP